MSSYDLKNKAFLEFLEENVTGHSEKEMEETFDAMLDECHKPYTVGGCTYDPSDILRNVDPTAYRCGFNDYTAEYVEVGNVFYEESEIDKAWDFFEEECESK